MRGAWIAAALLLVLAGCRPEAPDGLTLQSSVVVSPAGAEERRVEIFEDSRITPALRPAMWGAAKDPSALAASIRTTPLRRAVMRLVDRQGTILGERRLDCELGAVAPMQQAGQAIWTLIDDCSTGEGDYAGLITYFFAVVGDKLAFESIPDGHGGQQALTLVQARRIDWQTEQQGVADLVREVSSHPDFDDPRVKALKDDEPLPADLPIVTDFIRYRYVSNGQWSKHVLTDRHLAWSRADGFPDKARFPE